MSFNRVNLLGWALFEELTSLQMNQLDIDHSNSIDGLNGGIYNLAAPLELKNESVTFDSLKGTIQNGDWLGLSARGIVRSVPMSALVSDLTPGFAGWTFGGHGVATESTVPASALVFDVTDLLPIGSQLNAVTAYVNGGAAGGHAAFVALQLPSLAVYTANKQTGASALLGSKFDFDDIKNPANKLAYEQPHSFSVTGLTHTTIAPPAYRVLVELIGEQGADAEVNELAVFSLEVNFSVSAMRY